MDSIPSPNWGLGSLEESNQEQDVGQSYSCHRRQGPGWFLEDVEILGFSRRFERLKKGYYCIFKLIRIYKSSRVDIKRESLKLTLRGTKPFCRGNTRQIEESCGWELEGSQRRKGNRQLRLIVSSMKELFKCLFERIYSNRWSRHPIVLWSLSWVDVL